MELSKLQESHTKLQEDNSEMQNQHNAEYQQLKQEKENELASMKGKSHHKIVVCKMAKTAFLDCFARKVNGKRQREHFIKWHTLLSDEVANLQRKNFELQNKLDLLMQNNQVNMVIVIFILPRINCKMLHLGNKSARDNSLHWYRKWQLNRLINPYAFSWGNLVFSLVLGPCLL